MPPDTGIVHQVNLEYLARVIFQETSGGQPLAYPDTLVGTDSHTTMVNGLGVVGWGVGGIEAEAAMLGQPISMLIPEVVGFRLVESAAGRRDRDRSRADDHRTAPQVWRGRQVRRVLRARPRVPDDRRSRDARQHVAGIRRHDRDLPDRRDDARLPAPHRPRESHVQMVEAYAKEQGLFRTAHSADPVYTSTLELDLSTVEPSLAGPKRPQDRVSLRQSKYKFQQALDVMLTERKPKAAAEKPGEIGSPAAQPAATAVAVATEVAPGHGRARPRRRSSSRRSPAAPTRRTRA